MKFYFIIDSDFLNKCPRPTELAEQLQKFESPYQDTINQLLELAISNHKLLKKIIMTQAEEVQFLQDLKAQLVKINGEVQAKLQALADAIANQGTVSPEVEAALNDLKSTAQGLDDLVPDAEGTDTGSGTTETPAP